MTSENLRKSNPIVGVDMPLNSACYPIKVLLETFRDASELRTDIQFVLAGRRDAGDNFSIWNFLEQNNLTDRVMFFPYYERCSAFPVKKRDCWKWVPRDIPPHLLNAQSLLTRPEFEPSRQKVALFVTCFHVERFEGNARLMRQWLDHLHAAGYKIHVLYYATDHEHVSEKMRERARKDYDLWREVPVTTKLVGKNRNGLNTHVDDWCGPEVIDAVTELATEHEYDIAVVNYAFMTAVFECLPDYTQKLLLTHDMFTNRNQRLHQQGYPLATWVSLAHHGEKEAFDRSDYVIALQDQEARQFAEICGDESKIRVVSPVLDVSAARRMQNTGGKLRVGYIGSANWENEQNLARYLRAWLERPDIVKSCEIVIGGGVCANFANWVEDGHILLEKISPVMVGRVEDITDFYNRCDVIVNPERGGTGIKIKTLEAMAAGMPVISTAAGSLGIGSTSRFHRAADPAELAALTDEIAADPRLRQLVDDETTQAYHEYVNRNYRAMDDLLGASTSLSTRRRSSSPPRIPAYVARNAASYQIDLFKDFFSRVDFSGKRILEVGSDYHLATARMFAANGAAEVVAINIADWKSEEPLPDNVSFRSLGINEFAEEADNKFDVVYGIALLEHIDNPEAISESIWKVLAPGGIACLDGGPIWTGPVGHHVWIDDPQSGRCLYAFNDPKLNPIPDWAHLVLRPSEMEVHLKQKGIPPNEANDIVNFVYNVDGKFNFVCSNFKSPTDIINGFQKKFSVDAIRYNGGEANEYYWKALDTHSALDLSTTGLKLILTPRPDRSIGTMLAEPLVSVIVPFYNVEEYIEECIASILAQDYQNIEIIFVNDSSPDGSRAIVERHLAKDLRILLVTHQKNQGLGPARNTGVRYASGEYLFFLDSDDLLTSPSAIRTLVTAIKNHGCMVVTGACVNLHDDGSITSRDHADARGALNADGGVVSGLNAFFAGMRIANEYYLPPRAWGTLIAKKFYDELALDYPAGEHEDMGHMPFLYAAADSVLYINDIIVTYRNRSGSLSLTPWDLGRIERYLNLWRHFKDCVHRFGLEKGLSASALQHCWHVVWRLQNNSLAPSARDAAVSLLAEMLGEVTEVSNFSNFHGLVDDLRKFIGEAPKRSSEYRRIMGSLPRQSVLDYYLQRLEPAPTLGMETKSMDSKTEEKILTQRSSKRSTDRVESETENQSSKFMDRNVRSADIPAIQNLISEICDWVNRANAQVLSIEDARAIQSSVHALDVAAGDIVRKLEPIDDSQINITSYDGAERLTRWIMSPDAPWLASADPFEDDGCPAMITEEEKRYYRWLGKFYSKKGRIVELGPWLGSSTINIIRGLNGNPHFQTETIHVYDDFIWRKDWMDQYVEPHDRLPQHADFQHLFFRSLRPYQSKITVTKSRFAVYDGNNNVPEMSWNKGPIELIYVDCGRTAEGNEAWWRELSPHFIPGVTLVVMQDWRLHRELPRKWINQTDHFTDAKGSQLTLVHEVQNGGAATFLYR